MLKHRPELACLCDWTLGEDRNPVVTPGKPATMGSVGRADSSHPTIAQHDINPTRLEADRYREVIKATLVAEELVHNVQADVVVRRALAGDALVYVLWTKPTEVILIVWIGRIE